MSSGSDLLKATYSSELLPSERVSICDWIEDNIVLSPGETNSPGEYRFRRTPYLREVLETLSPDCPVQRVVCMKGAQLGFTIGSGAYVGYLIAQRPRNILFVSPTVDLAKRASRRKVGPILQNTEVLSRLVRDGGGRKAGSSTLFKEFPGGALIFAGANSGAGLRQTSAAVAILDEIDIYPASLAGEGDPVVLAERATKTFAHTRKHLYISTPTMTGRSRIETLYEASDRSCFYVPCPKCGEFQVLVFTDKKTGRRGLRWEGDFPNLKIWYQCEKCEAQIDEGSKAWMLDMGIWQADVPALSKHTRGFHISSLYASPGTFSWKDAVEQFIGCGKDSEKLRAFINQVLAESWEEKGDAPPWEDLYRRREHYPMGIVPDRGLVLTAGADVQRDRIEVEIVAWGRGLESWSVEYVIIPGDTASEKPWLELDRLFTRPWHHAGGLDLRIRGLAVDSGFETQGVYNWARKKPADSVFAVKGMDSLPTLVGHPTYCDLNWRGKKVARAVRMWPVGTSVAKRELYGWLRLQAPMHEAEGEPWPAGFVHFPQYREEHFKQLTAEQLVARHRKHDRQIVYLWDRKYERNESLDCFSDDTEVLTDIGWRRFSDLNGEESLATVNLDSETIEYQRPTALIARDHSGPMIHLKSRRLDILVTPDHRMVTFKKRFDRAIMKWRFDDPPQITLAKDLTIHHQLMVAAKWVGEDRKSVTVPASISKRGSPIGSSGKFLGETVSYEGRVYCASVPNGTLVVRRKGQSFVAGNCRVYARAAAAIIGLDRWGDADWDAADAALHKPTAATPVAAPASRKRAKTQGIWSRWRD